MQIVKSREYRTAFQVDAWDIERLVDRLGGDERVTRLGVEFSDGSGTDLPHSAALSELPNRASRAVASIWIESAPPSFLSADDSESRLALVRLRDGGGSGISWYVSGDERAVQTLSAELDDWADSVTPWFGRLACMDAPGLVLRGFLMLGSVAALSVAVPFLLAGVLSSVPLALGRGLALGGRFAALGCLALLAIATLWVGVRPKVLFPTAQFRFGEGARHFERLDRRRGMAVRWSGALALATLFCATFAGLLR